MKYLFTIAFCLLFGRIVQGQHILQTLDQRWPKLGLIAIVNVGEVSEVSTTQGLVLQSATAKIEKLIYRRFPPLPNTPRDEIIIYSFLPNGFLVVCPSPITLTSGRAFVMVRQQGINRFFPSDPWEFQHLDSDTLMWPTETRVEKRPIQEVISEIEDYATSHANE